MKSWWKSSDSVVLRCWSVWGAVHKQLQPPRPKDSGVCPTPAFFPLAGHMKSWEAVRLQVARHFGAWAVVLCQDSHLLDTFTGVVCSVVACPHVSWSPSKAEISSSTDCLGQRQFLSHLSARSKAAEKLLCTRWLQANGSSTEKYIKSQWAMAGKLESKGLTADFLLWKPAVNSNLSQTGMEGHHRVKCLEK